MVHGHNEVESLRPDASLTMSTVHLLASLPDARTYRQHPSNAAQESRSPLTMHSKMQAAGERVSAAGIGPPVVGRFGGGEPRFGWHRENVTWNMQNGNNIEGRRIEGWFFDERYYIFV